MRNNASDIDRRRSRPLYHCQSLAPCPASDAFSSDDVFGGRYRRKQDTGYGWLNPQNGTTKLSVERICFPITNLNYKFYSHKYVM